MSRISHVVYEEAEPEIREAWDKVIEKHGAVTNMKAVLLHSPTALNAVLEWYSLYAKVKPVLGQRLTILFCDAISRENACQLCSSYMRKGIIDSGEDPENLVLSERDKVIVGFGRQLADDPNRITDEAFSKLYDYLTEAQIVELTAFGALMIVNNVFNNALRIDLDDVLAEYRVTPEVAFAGSSRYQSGKEQS
ncbi:MAG TPA: hypothetical protein VN367_05230 [Chlorobaculum sp.]|jgi:alkylhydroperoxidase family enzyme|nr:hypothetical protein [Chlorobaculum sp.]